MSRHLGFDIRISLYFRYHAFWSKCNIKTKSLSSCIIHLTVWWCPSCAFPSVGFNFRFVHFKGKPPIWVIRFVSESIARILWMSWRFHRQFWYLKRENFSYSQVVPYLQGVQLHVGARHRVPEAQPGSYYVLSELPPPNSPDDRVQGVKDFLLISKAHLCLHISLDKTASEVPSCFPPYIAENAKMMKSCQADNPDVSCRRRL